MNARILYIRSTKQKQMKEINLNLNKNKKYVVACSYGPDSMALLHAVLQEKLNVVVAHVNYRKREASQAEQDNLQKYCDLNKLKLYVLDLKDAHAENNFQNWAREVRYKFFKEVLEKEDADEVLIAHQEDDMIETYLMQKNRGNYVKNPGISQKITLFDVPVYRPLLGYTKKELQDYDVENNVPYSIDSSNLTDDYERNKIRHKVVEKMDKEQRESLLCEMKQKQTFINPKTNFSVKEFCGFEYEEIIFLLDHYLQKNGEHRDISKKFVLEIKKAILSSKNIKFDISDKLRLEKDYDNVYFVNKERLKSYSDTFKNKFTNEVFDIDFTSGIEERGMKKNHGLLTIKNCSKNDATIIKDYKSRINRLFIDWKMPLFLREVWPGIYDEKGNLLYVPRYRKNFRDNHTSVFKINIEYFIDFD